MSTDQPRKPAGTPAGGEFANKTGSAPTGSLTAYVSVSDEWKQKIDAIVEAVPRSAEPMQYVICVRHPDESNGFYTFGDAAAGGKIEVVDIDLGSSFDGSPETPEQAAEWAERQLATALSLTSEPAREAMFTVISDCVADTYGDTSDVQAAIDYARTVPAPAQVRQSDEQAISVLSRMKSERGFAGTMFTRTDCEDHAGRELTDEEWDRVRNTWAWSKGMSELLTERGWELVADALADAGVEPVEDDE